ncbi:MAG: PEP-utilizing enzyme [Actinomycetota bacterium]|nr:PEP-utilizing enzyme [Actinomycetota bacterium]
MTVTWEAPGPGQWALDRSHMPPGCTALVQELMVATEPAAMRRVFAELGAPVDTISAAFVNGFLYTRLRPLIAPDRPAGRLPPQWLLKLVMRLHPEMRRREKTASKVLATTPWTQVIHEWHHGGRAAIVAANLALQDVHLPGLTDAALMAHVRDCWNNCLTNWQHHFWLHGYDLGPLGRYLHVAEGWGVPAEELLSLLEGASPSTSGPAREAAEICRLLAECGAQPATLAQMRSASPEVDVAVGRYLREREWVLFSRYDFDGLTLGERPDIVLASILSAVDRDRSDSVAERTVAVCARIPQQHRAEFDTLLAGARQAMDLRDDNGPVTAEWPVGLVRRALLEVGRRLVTAGRAQHPQSAVELLPGELQATDLAALPAGEVLQARADQRAAQAQSVPPLLLGPPEPVPPLDVLPPALAQMVGSVQSVVRHLGMDGVATASGLHGVGVGSTPLTAVARVAASPEDALDRLQPGEVLVVACTTPAYNLVLSLAGAVVTASGGPMCHAAVLARELGIPAVVGAHAALTTIPDGALVEVVPAEGLVRVLS